MVQISRDFVPEQPTPPRRPGRLLFFFGCFICVVCFCFLFFSPRLQRDAFTIVGQ